MNRPQTAFVTLILATLLRAASAVVLTPGGTEVVVDRTSTPTARYAGAEATNFLSQALGSAVPLVAAPTEGKVHLFVGDSPRARAAGLDVAKLARDAFFTRAAGSDIYLLGRDDPKENPLGLARGNLRLFVERATVFAVYDFLERFADCRFFFPGELGTVVPRRNRIAVPDCDRVTAPDSDERRYTRDVIHCGAWYDPSVDRRCLHGVNWMRWRLATRILPCCHGQRHFHYVRRFAKDHPDWFCLKADGTRNLAGENVTRLTQGNKFCYSSPIREEIYRDVRAYLTGADAKTRGLDEWRHCRDGVVDVMPEDGFAECRCPACQATYAKTRAKNPSPRCHYANDQIWGLTAEIGRRLKEEGVRGGVTQMAYWPYGVVPDFDLPDNIQVMVATHGPWDVANRDAFARELARIRSWHEKTRNRVWLWTYPGHYKGDYPCVPIVCPRAYATFYKAVSPHARVGYAENECERFAYDLVNLYMFSRLAWDPTQDPEAILTDYCARLFGPAAAPMAAVFDLLEKKWIGGVCSGGSVNTPVGPQPIRLSDAQLYADIYTEGFFAEADRLFDAAVRRTRAGTRERRTVEMFRRELIEPLRAERKRRLDPSVELARRAGSRGVNLLKDGGFAEGKRHWRTKTPKSPPSFDATDRVTGAACCVLNGVSADPPHFYTYASVSQGGIRVSKGKTYRLSYFLKCRNVVPTKPDDLSDSGAGGCVWLPGGRYYKFPAPRAVGTHGWICYSHVVRPQADGEVMVEFRLVQATGEMRVSGAFFGECPDGAD